MFVSFTLMLSVQCIACKAAMPVNGVVGSVACSQCGERHELATAFWKSALEPRRFAAAMGFAEGEGKPVQAFGSPQFSLAYGKRTPRCQQCKGPDLAIADLIAAVPSGRASCPACGFEIRVRDADAACKAIEPNARIVVHESTADPVAETIRARTTPVLFACLGCGAGLSVDGGSRSVICTYCQASNYLPDGLWQHLRPVPKSHVWFLVCEYDEASARRARFADDGARREIAGSRDATAEDLAILAADPDEDVRERVGANPRTDPATLARLAIDERLAVQVAVATNQHTSLDGQRALAPGR